MSTQDTYDLELERFIGLASAAGQSNADRVLTESDSDTLSQLRKSRNAARAAYLESIGWRD